MYIYNKAAYTQKTRNHEYTLEHTKTPTLVLLLKIFQKKGKAKKVKKNALKNIYRTNRHNLYNINYDDNYYKLQWKYVNDFENVELYKCKRKQNKGQQKLKNSTKKVENLN